MAIETSGLSGSVALAETAGNAIEIIDERPTAAGQRTARSLLPAIRDALGEHGWSAKEIELVCVTTGPGSFTGLRIGVVAAKTLAYATGAPLVAVHTLAAIAAGIEPLPRRLWTVVDAQRQQLFVDRFNGDQPLIEQAYPDTEILSWPDLVARLAAGDQVAGPGLAKGVEAIPAGVQQVEPRLWNPTAGAVAPLGAQLFERGSAINPLELVPHYYRKSAAEEKAAGRK